MRKFPRKGRRKRGEGRRSAPRTHRIPTTPLQSSSLKSEGGKKKRVERDDFLAKREGKEKGKGKGDPPTSNISEKRSSRGKALRHRDLEEREGRGKLSRTSTSF